MSNIIDRQSMVIIHVGDTRDWSILVFQKNQFDYDRHWSHLGNKKQARFWRLIKRTTIEEAENSFVLTLMQWYLCSATLFLKSQRVARPDEKQIKALLSSIGFSAIVTTWPGWVFCDLNTTVDARAASQKNASLRKTFETHRSIALFQFIA